MARLQSYDKHYRGTGLHFCWLAQQLVISNRGICMMQEKLLALLQKERHQQTFLTPHPLSHMATQATSLMSTDTYEHAIPSQHLALVGPVSWLSATMLRTII